MHNLFTVPNLYSKILNLGATNHFSISSLLDISSISYHTITSSLLNNNIITSTHKISLNYKLPPEANTYYILSNLNTSLLSIG